MKKLKMFFTTLILLIIIFMIVILIRQNVQRTYQIGENVVIKVPLVYENVKNKNEDTLIELYNKEKGISISAIEVNENFWSSGDTESRMNEYLNLISKVNYEAGLKNLKTEIIEKTDEKIGKVEFELTKNYDENESISLNESKAITLITHEEIGDIVIEIIASKEIFDKNEKEIETIVKSVKIKG